MAIAGLGRKFVSALVKEKSTSSLLKMGGIDYLFKDHEIELFKFVQKHAKKHGTLPSAETVFAHTNQELAEVPENASYYRELLEKRYVEQAIKEASKTALDMLKPEQYDLDAAFGIMKTMVTDVLVRRNDSLLTDFRETYAMLLQAYHQQHLGEGGGMLFGWPTLDAMSGGLGKGDLISFVGRPAQGKTWFLIFASLYGWYAQKKRILFVSMEMQPLSICQRLISLHAKIGFKHLKSGMSDKHYNKFKAKLTEISTEDAPYWVVDGNLSATVEDVWALASYLKPDGIYIDGGYLMKHPRERDRFKRVAENCNLMKQELTPIAPTTVSWQFAKSGAKKNKKKGEKADLEDIGYTDAIAQDSSLVAGLMQPEGIETMHKRLVEILKGRNGEVGNFMTHWNFEQMDFTEIKDVPVADLQYV